VKSDKIVAPCPDQIGDARVGEVGDLFTLVSASLEGVIQMNLFILPVCCQSVHHISRFDHLISTIPRRTEKSQPFDWL
jgi:hypothetical protein